MNEFMRVRRRDAVTNLSPESRRPRSTDIVIDVTEEQVKNALDGLALPLDPRKGGRIIGYGVESVAFRTHDLNDRAYVGVLSPEKGDLLQLVKETKQTTASFGEYGVPVHTIRVNGWENKPMVLKISPEIQGGTLHEMGLLYLLGNTDLIADFIEIAQKAKAHLKKQGTLIDFSGYRSDDKIRHTLSLLFPVSSQNIVVDEGSNTLKFVDLETHATRSFANVPTKGKLTLGLETVSLYTWTNILKGAHAMHTLLKNINKPHLSHKENNGEQQTFDDGIAHVVAEMNKLGINYVVVGSVAHAATLATNGIDYPLSARRQDTSIRDIDIIVFDNVSDELRALMGEFKAKTDKLAGFPEVNIATAYDITDPSKKEYLVTGRFIPVTHTIPAQDTNGNCFLSYKDIFAQIPPELLTPVVHNYKDIPIRTLAPGVLAGLWETRGGAIKFKDRAKAVQLLATTHEKIPPFFSDFAHEIRTRYPKDYQKFLLREFLMYMSQGNIRPTIVKNRLKNLLHLAKE